MVKEAFEKLRAEMEQHSDNSSVQRIGNFLIKKLEINQDIAEKILEEEKTIIKSLETMRNVAMENTTNSMAVLTDEEGFEIVMEFYGIEKANGGNAFDFLKKHI